MLLLHLNSVLHIVTFILGKNEFSNSTYKKTTTNIQQNLKRNIQLPTKLDLVCGDFIRREILTSFIGAVSTMPYNRIKFGWSNLLIALASLMNSPCNITVASSWFGFKHLTATFNYENGECRLDCLSQPNTLASKEVSREWNHDLLKLTQDYS